MSDTIFYRELYGSTSNAAFPILLQVERPARISEGEWMCRVSLQANTKVVHTVRGVDGWQAVELSIAFLRNELKILRDGGVQLMWPAQGGPFTELD